MGYLFTLDKLYYVNSTLTEIPINSLQLAALKTKLGITLDAMDKVPQPLSYAAQQVIAEVTSKITELEIATWRQELLRQLETMAHPYQDPEVPSVKLVPVWHGTQKDLVPSIAQAGYSFENFDAHFAPVRPSKMNPDACYYPCRPGERATYHEVVVFDRNRMLPRYVVELQPSLVRPLVTLGLFA